MNREDGFPIADIDVGLFHDQKVLALARRLKDERETAAHVALYVNLILESWSAGDRVQLDEALPAWWVGDPEDARIALLAVGLIDDESRLPVEAWGGWFVPAFDRREKRRQSGAEGGRRSWQSRRDKRNGKHSRSDASATPNPSVLPAGRPTYRQGRPEVVREITNGLEPLEAAEPSCDACGEPLLGTSWSPRKTNEGRMANVHEQCYQVEKAGAA